jgi:sec-independent protein translocase protein TatB
MFDFDAGKLLVIGIVALIVIGPKELPRVLRQVGQMVGKLRRMAAEFQSQFMDAVKEAELEDIRNDLTKMADQTKIDTSFNPIHMVRNELTEALADKPREIVGAPSLGLAGLSEASELPAADFADAGAAPFVESVDAAPALEDAGTASFLEHANSRVEPSVAEPTAVDPIALEPSEPTPLRKIGGT